MIRRTDERIIQCLLPTGKEGRMCGSEAGISMLQARKSQSLGADPFISNPSFGTYPYTCETPEHRAFAMIRGFTLYAS